MLLHRFRAERLLRDEFESLRADVTGNVAARLRVAGVHLDACDLDACYAAAWQGLYAAMLDGQTVDNPAGWLALVTYRRALDEHRARRRIAYTPLEEHGEGGSPEAGSFLRTPIAGAFAGSRQRDLAAELDDRTRLRQLLEALCARLSAREREAAALCYLHGLSRAEAAAQMGISESRMRKLMEGRGSARPGVCAKLGALVETIDAGRWCEEQGSLMRGFAYGILDPQGNRYKLARAHHTACPSCRAYVLSLRGLAAVLPPVPAMLHLALGAAGGAAGAATATGTGAGAAGGVGSGASGSALSASGAAGAGAAGGGWWLAGGPIGAKLAVGCVLALGVGAGCVALEGHSHGGRTTPHRHITRASAERRGVPIGAALAEGHVATSALAPAAAGAATSPTEDVRRSSVVTDSRAAREFGPEQAARAEASSAQVARRRPTALARTASAVGGSGSSAAGSTASASRASSGAGAPARTSVPAAAREFAPG